MTGNVIELLSASIEEFCKECCAGTMIYGDDLKRLHEWCDEHCPFLKRFESMKGEENGERGAINKRG